MPKLPPPTNLNASAGADEATLLNSVLNMWREGKRHRESFLKDSDTKESVALYRGEVSLSDANEELIFSANFIQAFIDRLVSQLTDNRPILRHEPTKAEMARPAKAIQKITSALWDESAMQRQLFKMCHNAAIKASAGFHIDWNPMTDNLAIELLTRDQVSVHPGVREAGRFNEAEYLVIRRSLPLDLIADRYTLRGSLVKPNVRASRDVGGSSGSTIIGADEAFAAGAGLKKVITTDEVPHAWVYEAFVVDRQKTADGKQRLFPTYRHIHFSEDIILWDGPLKNWHGLPSIEWFDWTVDPDHPWGISEPQNLKRMQLAFNDMTNGTVTNAIDINNTWVTGTANAQEDKEWLSLENEQRMRVLRHPRNETLNIVTPPVYGPSQLGVSRFIFTMAQLITGVTDVTLGENPGSLQSGVAIEGLQEASNLMTRARQSRLEDFMTRVGQKITALILQHLKSDRMFALTGPIPEAVTYVTLRNSLLQDDGEEMDLTIEKRRDILKYIRFNIAPGSSAPGARQRRAALMMKLVELGAASTQDVLEAADFPPDVAKGMIDRARQDFQNNPALQAKLNGGRNRADRESSDS